MGRKGMTGQFRALQNGAPLVACPIANGFTPLAGRKITFRLTALFVLSLALAMSRCAFAQSSVVLTNLAQVRAVSLMEGTKGIPVALRATVTYIDPEWRMMFVQDQSGSAYVARSLPLTDASWNLQPGQQVDLKGITAPGIMQCNIKEQALHPVGQGPLPAPKSLDTEESLKIVDDARWARVAGMITVFKTLGKKLDLEFQAGPFRTLRLLVAQGNPINAQTLLGCAVEATGVYGLDLDASKRPTGTNVIWMNDLAGIQKMHSPPITPIVALAALAAKPAPVELAHVHGNVSSQSTGEFLIIRDDSGTVRVRCKNATVYPPGSSVEVFGYATSVGGSLVLSGARVITTNLQPIAENSPLADPIPLTADQNLPVLRQIAEVRNLTASDAARGYPVRIRGVVTYTDTNGAMLFIQDDSGGIFIDSNGKQFNTYPEARKLVEITGFTGPGDYAPVVEAEKIRVLGEAALPQPDSSPMQVLMTGTEDSQWVALDGVIRRQNVVETNTVMNLAVGNSVIQVTVPYADEHPAPRSFVDAWVEVRGVVATVFDDHRHLQGIEILIPNWDEVRAWSIGADAPFSLPVQPLNKLLEFHAGGEGFHRTHAHGTVTLCRKDGSFYLQDATGGMLVQPEAVTNVVKVGQMLDVVGFASIVDKLPALQEAIVQIAKGDSGLKPTPIPTEWPLSQELHGTLVRLSARVIGHSSSTTDETLKVQFGSWIIDAILDKQQLEDKLGGIDPGCVVNLTGVYLARLDDSLQVQSFQLGLRSPLEVQVLARPSWWNARRIFWLLAVLGAAFAVALTWVTMLHKQVHERTRELRSEIEVRKRIEVQVAKTHQELLSVSHQAGMAEVATSVLHNVGNVLNSVNISATVVADNAKNSKAAYLGKVVALVNEHKADLGAFLTEDPKGRQLPDFLKQLAAQWTAEQRHAVQEMDLLRKNIEHIKDIVAMQQNYAKISGVTESVKVVDLVEDALRMEAGTLVRHQVELIRDYAEIPAIVLEKHKTLQILVNVIRNAKHACDAADRRDKRLRIQVAKSAAGVRVALTDNGVGIARENLVRIFNHGFTTRTGGHGFGLHSGALAAREMGGSLTVQSDGLGCGATFTLELPMHPPSAGL